jgi:hypothetical protein
MRRAKGLFLVACLATAATTGAADITVLTQNQYLGADLTPIVLAADATAFNSAVVTALQTVAANLPEQRMKSLALQILVTQPALVGLQESYEFTCRGEGCSDPSLAGAFGNNLERTLAALHGTYKAVAQVRNFSITDIPVHTATGWAYVGVTDRDVILARRDVAKTVAKVDYDAYCQFPSAEDGCNYTVVAPLTLLGQNLREERGFVAVYATVDGRKVRFVTTHLEQREPVPGNPYARVLQMAQAAQLIQTLQLTTPTERTLLVVGDINSDPRDTILPVPAELQPALGGVTAIVPPYLLFTNPYFAGGQYSDAWTRRAWPQSGFTCCQDGDLSNAKSVLYERIDMIFSATPPKRVIGPFLLGTTPWEKTWPPRFGVWPSDHAAVVATLQF